LDLAQKLLELRVSSGKSQVEISKLAGVSQRTWSSYERGETTPKMGVLWGLAAKGYVIEGLTSSFVGNTAEDVQKKIDERLKVATKEKAPANMLMETTGQYIDNFVGGSFFKFAKQKPTPIPTDESDPNAMVMLPLYSQRAAAGTGQPPTQLEELEAYIPVFLEILGGSNPRNCGAVRVVGDSMTDMTLYNGDLVFFDRSKLEGDGIYVISIHGDVRVKRLEYRTFEKKLIIRSENQKRYPDPEEISFEQAMEMLVIHGKVICWLHRHPY